MHECVLPCGIITTGTLASARALHGHACGNAKLAVQPAASALHPATLSNHFPRRVDGHKAMRSAGALVLHPWALLSLYMYLYMGIYA